MQPNRVYYPARDRDSTSDISNSVSNCRGNLDFWEVLACCRNGHDEFRLTSRGLLLRKYAIIDSHVGITSCPFNEPAYHFKSLVLMKPGSEVYIATFHFQAIDQRVENLTDTAI